ncbi:Bug family tripartite tricarboxylate transporter substrate binding protein [Pseudorhodoferax sp.]|uniref:Bug family tripartite tricarboxylate transporter substrate binding protein n=1 Tax=Pseudorhodoferax sp. TaxID=1993553 RepID=UPI002DD697F4|nr:tripartite tricarboxylate transporter substrate binding protein [Pseudorhodoferax sp.]
MTRSSHGASRRRSLRLLAAAGLGTLAGLAGTPRALAQGSPSRPLRMLVGFAPGGAMDIVARALGQKMGESMGQTVVVENLPGAGSNIAIRALIGSAPDGHTLMLVANGLSANPILYQPAPFDPERDVVPVAQVARLPVVIAAGANTPFHNLAAMLQAAKARPQTVAYGTPGNGSTPHLAMELFAHAAGVSLAHVPYKGGSPAITDVLGGQLPLVVVNAVEVLPHVKAGRLRVLAALSAERVSTLPDTPTIAESGFPGFEASVWHAVIAPRGTPAPVVDRLNAEVRKALALPDVKERLAALGAEVATGPAADLARLITAERERYARIIREAKIGMN